MSNNNWIWPTGMLACYGQDAILLGPGGGDLKVRVGGKEHHRPAGRQQQAGAGDGAW